MAAIWECRFPLVIICLACIRGLSPLPTATRVPGTRPTRLFKPRGFPSEDYGLPPDDYYTDKEPDSATSPNVGSTGPPGPPQRCDFSLCLENQTPCPELAASTGCLCPGFTMHDTAPQAPQLTSVSHNGSAVVLEWCAPYSDVTSYVVSVGGKQRHTFEKGQRSGALGHIDHISEVCLFAVNEAGDSEGSCKMYYPRTRGLPLTAGLVGGALGLLLLVLLAILLYRHRKQRKQEASISVHNTVESL